MKVKKIVNQMHAIFKCEHCGYELDGYASPAALPYSNCPGCGRSTLERRRYVIEFEAEGEIDTKRLLSAKQCFGDFSFSGVTCRYTALEEKA